MLLSLLLAISVAAPDLRVELERESLTGTHYRYRQFIGGLPVIGGEVNVTVRRDGKREEHRSLVTPTLAQAMSVATVGVTADHVWVNAGGVARLARREVSIDAIRYIDVETGDTVRTDELVFRAKPARVFDPNPVAKLNAPHLRDESDSASAVPTHAYDDVELLDTNDSGPLGGRWVQISDFQEPSVPPVDSSQPLIFNRSDQGFEDVNTYFHVDRSQRYLQLLGYVGTRALVQYAVEADTHAAAGTDDSFFIASTSVAGRGRMHFGEGGTDDAEDSDLIVHEYAHAIHEWISPGTFLGSFGSEARAISEGFGDYWAFSAKYAAARASGRDPFCIADWDARCWTDPASERCAYPAGSDCLRRVDSTKTVADFLNRTSAGTEHRNGEIWSAALVEIFIALTQRHGLEEGRRMTDTLVVESLFGAPPHPGFTMIARSMLAAERYISAGRNADVVCAAMTRRGILTDCVQVPRGELTFIPGSGSGVTVPDNDPTGVTLSAFVDDARPIEKLMVSVNIRHRGRGELRISLIAPDGTAVRLHDPSPERAPDLVTTFGRDSLPIDSLDVFRGRSARGEWRLRVVDVAFGDVATVLSWGLLIQFTGDSPASERPPATGSRQVVPVAGRTPGANSTFFQTDLRILNRGPRPTDVLLIFTPSGADGRTDFAAVRVVAPSDQVVAFDDVVRTLFGTAGIGQLEIAADVLASTRTRSTSSAGTFGLFAGGTAVEEAVKPGERAYIAGLRNDEAFRTNVGFAEVSGRPARVNVRLSGPAASQSFSVDLAPHSHMQLPVTMRDMTFLATIQVDGPGSVLAYGAVIDNRSGDPILIPALGAGRSTGGLIPAISAPGAFGTYWRTEYTITSVAGDTRESEHSYQLAGPRRVSGVYVRFDDVVSTLFERPNSIGSITALLPHDVIVTARVWTDGPHGTYGQFVPFGEPSSGVRDILHIEQSSAFRTNIGLLSRTTARVRVTTLDSSGTPLRATEIDLLPLQLIQFPVVDAVVNGRVRVEALSGAVYAYASVVDNGTGDPIFVPAR